MKRIISCFVVLQLCFVATIFSQTRPSVGEILNTDGTVRLDREGGYDLEGYKMIIDKDGKPRLLSKTESALSNSGTWNSVGTGSGNGMNNWVEALAVYNGELYVGGGFTLAGGVSANFIARWNGTSWNSVGTGSGNGVNDYVHELAVYNGELYVGGEFTSAGGVSANFIARWNGTSWNSVGTGSGNGVSSKVYELAEYNGELYVGGGFTYANWTGSVSTSLNANFIARWNGMSWNSVGTGSGNGVNSNVYALAVYNGELYIGGEFTSAGGVIANFIARWNGTSWNSVGTGSGNGVNHWVYALAVYNGELYVGGRFTSADGVSANFIARWNGTSWNSVGTGTGNGVNNWVYALAEYNGELYVGGKFRFANWTGSVSTSLNANFIARWTITGATDVEENELTPTNFVLHQNYPNPFNPGTRISWQVPAGSHQTLKVYDILGNEIATLVDEYRDEGSYEVEFNAGQTPGLSSGVYFYKLQAGNYVQVKKMILMK